MPQNPLEIARPGGLLHLLTAEMENTDFEKLLASVKEIYPPSFRRTCAPIFWWRIKCSQFGDAVIEMAHRRYA